MSPMEYKAYTVNGYVHSFVHASSNLYSVFNAAAESDGYIQARRVGERWGFGLHWKDWQMYVLGVEVA